MITALLDYKYIVNKEINACIHWYQYFNGVTKTCEKFMPEFWHEKKF